MLSVGPKRKLLPHKILTQAEDQLLRQGFGRYAAPLRKLWTALAKLDTYLRGQSNWLVNYAERHRAGECVGTAITEGTANFLVNRRMNKRQ